MSDDVQTVETVESATPEATEAQSAETQSTDSRTPEPVQGEEEQGEQDNANTPPKKSRAETRISELVGERNAERQRVAELEAKLAQANTGGNTPTKQVSDNGVNSPAPPDIAEFDLDSDDGVDKWLKAHADYESQLERHKFRQFMAEERTAQENAQRQTQIENDFKQAFERNPAFKDNFAQLIERNNHTPLPFDPSELFGGQELMDVLNTLATDEELYYELASLPPQRAYLKLGAVQASMAGNTSQAVKRSNAPTPPNHGKGNAPTQTDIHKLSDADFLKARGLK